MSACISHFACSHVLSHVSTAEIKTFQSEHVILRPQPVAAHVHSEAASQHVQPTQGYSIVNISNLADRREQLKSKHVCVSCSWMETQCVTSFLADFTQTCREKGPSIK